MTFTKQTLVMLLALTLPGCAFLGLSKPETKLRYCPTPDTEAFGAQPTEQEPAGDGSAGECLGAAAFAFENLREAERRRQELEFAIRSCLDPKSPLYRAPEKVEVKPGVEDIRL